MSDSQVDPNLKAVNYVEYRKQVCSSCEFKTNSLIGDRCKKCGCVIAVKIRVPMAQCPIRKW